MSARVRGYQEANSISRFTVLPLVLLVVGQTSGVMLAGPMLFAVLGAALAAVGAGITGAVVRSFSREKAASAYV